MFGRFLVCIMTGSFTVSEVVFLAFLCYSKHGVVWYLKLGYEHFLFSYMMLYRAIITDTVVLQPLKYLWVLTE
jgi:hypothetical protein